MSDSVRRWWWMLVTPLWSACGGSDAAQDAAPRFDAGPPPMCETSELEAAWSLDLDGDIRFAFDTDGTILVTVPHQGSDEECAELVRLDSGGSELWRHAYDPATPPKPNYRPCQGVWDGIAIDPDGAILTIGDDVSSEEQPGAGDIVVRKHDSDGNALWTYFNQNAPDDLEGLDQAWAIAAGADGDIVATGAVAAVPWVARLAPDGTARWAWSGSGEAAADVELAADGNAFVGITTSSGATPYRILRFDPEGNATTVAELSRPVSMEMTPDGELLFVDPSTGRLLTIDSSGEIVLEKVLAVSAVDGWCRRIDLSNSPSTAIGPDGSIYLVLSGEIDTSEPDFPSYIELTVLARFTPEGELLSVHLHDSELIDDLALGPDGSIAFFIDNPWGTPESLNVVAPLDESP